MSSHTEDYNENDEDQVRWANLGGIATGVVTGEVFPVE
jgi:hypothetical protein